MFRRQELFGSHCISVSDYKWALSVGGEKYPSSIVQRSEKRPRIWEETTGGEIGNMGRKSKERGRRKMQGAKHMAELMQRRSLAKWIPNLRAHHDSCVSRFGELPKGGQIPFHGPSPKALLSEPAPGKAAVQPLLACGKHTAHFKLGEVCFVDPDSGHIAHIGRPEALAPHDVAVDRVRFTDTSFPWVVGEQILYGPGRSLTWQNTREAGRRSVYTSW